MREPRTALALLIAAVLLGAGSAEPARYLPSTAAPEAPSFSATELLNALADDEGLLLLAADPSAEVSEKQALAEGNRFRLDLATRPDLRPFWVICRRKNALGDISCRIVVNSLERKGVNPESQWNRYFSDNMLTGVTDPLSRPIGMAVPTAGKTEYTTFSEPSANGNDQRYSISHAYLFDDQGRLKELIGGAFAGAKSGGNGPQINLTYGLDPDGRPSGLLQKINLGNETSQTWQAFGYDEADNLSEVESSYGQQSRAAYDEWDRPIRSLSGGGEGEGLGAVGPGGWPEGVSPPEEWQGLGAGQYTERGFDKAGRVKLERAVQDYIDSGCNPADTASCAIRTRMVTTRYEYNEREQVTKVYQTHLAMPGQAGVLDPAERLVLEMEYDQYGRLVRRKAYNDLSAPLITTYEYDSAGRVYKTRLGGAAAQEVGFDENGRVVYRHDGDNGVWTGRFDGWGRLYEEALPTGAVIRRKYDQGGNIAEETVYSGDPGQAGTKVLSRKAAYFTSFGEPDLTVDMLSEAGGADDYLITQRIFDGSGRTREVLSGPAASIGDGGFLTLQLDRTKARREMELEYHAGTGRVAWRRFGGFLNGDSPDPPEYAELSEYPVDSNGESLPWPSRVSRYERVPGETDLALTLTTEYMRDLQGRPLQVSNTKGDRMSTVFDRLGAVIQTETGAGTINRFAFDGRGQLLREIRPMGRGATSYAYDLDGRLLGKHAEEWASGGWQATWSKTFGYDQNKNFGAGWVTDITQSDSTTEHYAYNPDGTAWAWTTREKIDVTFGYDEANRLISSAPAPGAGFTQPSTLEPLGSGDSYTYDEASRLLLSERDDNPEVSIAYEGYDLAGRPASEVVGNRPALTTTYDVWSNPTSVTVPTGIGVTGHTSTFNRSYDSLSRLTSAESAIGGLGADWLWGGAGRLYGITAKSDLGTAVRYSYYGQPNSALPAGAPDPGATWQIASVTYGSGAGAVNAPRLPDTQVWGRFGFGWRGTAANRLDGAKVGRKVTDDPIGLLTGMGWSWELDTALRLTGAHAGAGSFQPADTTGASDTFRFGYGDADQLQYMRREGNGENVDFTSGPNGRIASRDGVPFGYDSVGRRTLDDRLSYKWDWRGRLYEVGVLATGHRVRYEYDAAGRLLWREHFDDQDALIEKRVFVWNGNGLISEVAYADEAGTALRWRKTYLPGPLGLDDQYQVRVETFPSDPAIAPVDTVYTLLRDEMGTVIGLIEEIPGGDPTAPPSLTAQYLYNPYGEAAIFVGEKPSLASTEYNNAYASRAPPLTEKVPGGQNLLFHGLWTDPVTGLNYARARWYDARNAGWLIEDPQGDVDSQNLFAFVAWRPHTATDPLGQAVKPHIGFVYEIYLEVDGEVIKYIGSARDLKERFKKGNHKWEDVIRHKDTRIRVKRARGNLSIEGSNRGTELSARKEALGSVEKLELDRAEKQAARRNENLKPGKKPTQIVNEDPIVSSEAKRTRWQETHEVSLSKRWTTVKKSGESFNPDRLPKGAPKMGKVLPRMAGAIDLYGTVKDAYAFARDQQLSQYEMAEYVLEDEGGAFVFREVENTRLFSKNEYYKEYIEGEREGEREEISMSDFIEYKKEAEALFGFIDWKGEFVPGLLNPELSCKDCA